MDNYRLICLNNELKRLRGTRMINPKKTDKTNKLAIIDCFTRQRYMTIVTITIRRMIKQTPFAIFFIPFFILIFYSIPNGVARYLTIYKISSKSKKQSFLVYITNTLKIS
ncbi:MAG: hypothetical protein N3A62_04230 [Thermodesulfovibrionales bacterium]|nr:hypothetical protein [Thermodesulfovibrionales bacterium]